MRLIFDARPMAQPYTGLGRYTGSLLRTLLNLRNAPDFAIDVLLNEGENWNQNFYYAGLSGFAEDSTCRLHFIPSPAISLKQQLAVPAWVNRRGADRYFYPHFDLPLGVNVPSTFIVHDVIPLKVESYVQKFAASKRAYFKMMIKMGVRRAERCFAVSKTTRHDILELTGENFADKVDFAYEGPVLDIVGNADYQLANSVIEQPYLLYVGDRRPHKNLKRIIDLFVSLRGKHCYEGCLALVGSTRNYGFDVDSYIRGRSDIKVLGNVSDPDLCALYAGTDALLFLSEYEGFGLPVVEAQRFGKKMVLSDGGALAEIAPPTACIIERATSVEHAASVVTDYLNSPLRPDVEEWNSMFTWESAVRKIFPEAFR